MYFLGYDGVGHSVKSSAMEIGGSVQQEGRSWNEKLRCRLFYTPGKVSSHKYRRSYSPCTEYDKSHFYARAKELTKVQGSEGYSESAPLLVGINKRPEFTRTNNFNEPPPSSIFLTY